MAKVQISIDDDLLARVDAYADQHYTTRSGCISQSLVQLLASAELMDAVKDMAVSMRRIADNGEIDDETKKDLEHFEYIAKAFTSK